MANKKGLGRGLDALLESYEPGKGPASLQEISVYDIDTNPDQPRKTFDEEKLNELAGSIKTHGIVQPLILYRQGNREETEQIISVWGFKRQLLRGSCSSGRL